MMENLAPAGNEESLERAVAAGADAVYLGYASFSARAGAGNFDEEQLRKAVAYAHLHHVRVHVTVNTLVKDAELDEVLDVLRLLDDVPVDAVLVQDLGVLRLARQCFPGLPVHASTQMAIHNVAGVRWCKRQGMTRAVLARECSVAEIALCAAEGLEIEVFGHGAQCVAVSGECLFSSMGGERSGNRGRCAQPCRLPYVYRGRQGAWLSPRDVCLRDDLPQLERAGACSIKLEGRLKRPEYVAVVAGSYRKALDSLAQGAFQKADEAEKRDLLQIFQRGGLMRGYAMGAEDAGVICEDRVNHGGVGVGEILFQRGNLAQARMSLPLHDGDGLQIRTARGDVEMIYAGREVPAGGTATLRLREDVRVSPGDQVVRLTDGEQLAAARAMAVPPIPMEAWLEAMPDKPLTLTVTDGQSVVTVRGEAVAEARSRAMTEADGLRSLSKTGDTPFALQAGHVRTENAFVAVSVLNALRREALEKLEEARAEAFAREKSAFYAPDEMILPQGDVPPTAILRDMSQATLVPQGYRLVWYPEDWREEALRAGLAALPEGTWLQLPTVCEEATLEMIHDVVCASGQRLGGVILGSVGQLGLEWPLPYGAGAGIPVMNRRAAQLLLEEGCAFVTASCELSGRELQALLAGHPPILVPAYGRTQLMLLHHCPARTYLGLSQGHAACRLCDQHSPDSLQGQNLTSTRGMAYPLLRQRMPEGCLVRLMDALPLDLRGQTASAGYTPLWELTTETTAADLTEGRTTVGHWTRPVE